MLKRRFTRPGLVVSALVHAGALAATLIAFSTSEKFEDQQETVPVEVVTDNQFNQIMKGDKSAKEVRPEATQQAEQQASLQPTPPTPDQAHDAPPPPPPPPPPPQTVQQPPPAPKPPPRPPQPKVTPPPPTPPVRDVEAEPVMPKPVPRPPAPPVVHTAAVKPPPPKPRPVEKPKPDLLAKLMEEPPAVETPQPPPPKPSIRKPKPPDPPSESKFDLTDITKLLLGHSEPAQKPAANNALSHLASLGSPTASAAKMSPSFWAGLDGVMEDQYRSCWSYLGLSTGVKYIPQVRVVYGSDGSLQGTPVLVNPPSDPSLQSLADSALRAVRRCNPLRIPEQYAPFYEQWKGRVLRFDPEEMAG